MNNLPSEIIELVKNNPGKTKAYLAISSLTKDTTATFEIITNNLYTDLQESATWEEIKENALIFGSELLDAHPENYDKTMETINKIESLKGEEIENYFSKECGFFLFPDFEIAFRLDDKVKTTYGIN